MKNFEDILEYLVNFKYKTYLVNHLIRNNEKINDLNQ